MVRIRGASSFAKLRHGGRRVHHPLVILFHAENELEYSRYAVSASRRLGNAVKRNRAKRRLREAIRHHREGTSAGWDYLLVARSGAATSSFQEITDAVGDLLRRARTGQPVADRA